MRLNLVKREQASAAILNFLIAAVVTVFVTRAYLRMLDYPQFAFGVWHIAHVLWGGLLMLMGIILLLVFEGRGIKKVASIVSGIGWGLFIDEIGKYLTRDNNYFFRPAIIFIYLSFIALFLIYRQVEKYQPKDRRSQIYWLIDKIKRLAEDGINNQEKHLVLKRIKELRQKSDFQKILLAGIEEIVKKTKIINMRDKPTLAKWMSKILNQTYNKFFRRKLVMISLWIYAVYYSLEKIVDALTIGTSGQKMMMIEKFYTDYDFFGKSDVYLIFLKIIFEVIASLYFLLGASHYLLQRRIKGLKYFQYGLLVSILLVAPFKFYFEQFGAVLEVGTSLVVYQLVVMYRKEAVR